MFVATWLWKEGNKKKKIVKVLMIKTQINPTTYCTYDSKKKNPKTSIIVITIAKKKKPTPTTYSIYDNTQKMNNYWIPCIVNVINDCHNNLRVVKGR
jgi:hypothetical protein